MNHFEFCGTNPRVAKRRALNYWYINRGRLGMTMSQFFSQCRMREARGETQIIFYPANVHAPQQMVAAVRT
jgi:hypothetical protein